MDDIQKRRIKHEIASIKNSGFAGGESPEILRILDTLGLGRDVIASGRCAMPFMVLGAVTGMLADHGAHEQVVLDCLGGLENTHAFAPYWIEVKDVVAEGVDVAIIDQCARYMRVAYNEIWEIFLDLDETFTPENGAADPTGEAKVDAARKKAMAVCRFLIGVTWQVLPAHLTSPPDDAVTPPPAGA